MSDEPETLELALEPPVKVKGGEVSSISLSEPKARFVRDAERKFDEQMSEASILDYQIALVSACAGVAPVVVEAMSVTQLGEAFVWLQAFVKDAYEAAKQEDTDELPVGPFEVEIEPPLTWNKISYSSISLREPTTAEVKQSRTYTRQTMSIFTVRQRDMELLRLVSGLPPAVIDSLRITTLTEATRQLNRFLAAGQRTGRA